MSFTLQQSQFLSPLLGDDEISALFTVEADLAAMLSFEVALARAQAKLGIIPASAARHIEHVISTFVVDEAKLSQAMARDGMAVPELLRQLKAKGGGEHLHHGATSQDVIDTSLMLRARKSFAILLGRLEQIDHALEHMRVTFGVRQLMAHTRMQRALPMTVADRIASWKVGLDEARRSLEACKFAVQFGGPIGTLREFGSASGALKAELAGHLGLECESYNWHTARGPIVAIGNAASQLTGALGKIGADYCLMAQNELAEVKLSSGGTSSAMHHKQNPVLAETLVTLARFNATLISGLHQSMVHEQERSGAAWTLEWMLLPQMIVAAGAATRIAGELFQSTIAMGQA